jgi:hypothetical protein
MIISIYLYLPPGVLKNTKTKLKELNLPEYSFKIAAAAGDSRMIFDRYRRKWVKLTPEEWVRQNFVSYLVDKGGYPPGLIGIERMFVLNGLKRRFDILVHNREGAPVMLIECKAPDVEINEKVFDQIVCYNMKFRVPLIAVTNGINHFICKVNNDASGYEYLLVIPLFNDILSGNY